MQKKKLLAGALVLGASVAWAGVPTHENYIKQTYGWMYKYYSQWQPGNAPNWYDSEGNPMADDENFFIGRVRFKPRFENTKTQVKPDLKPQRKLLWWCPIGTTQGGGWTSMPNYEFDYDNFSSWSYIDIYGNWTQGFLRQPGVFSDVAHKNGVATSVVSTAAWSVTVTTNDNHGKNYQALSYGGADKLMKMLKYYGIDGLGFNSEQEWGSGLREKMQTLLKEAYNKRESYKMPQLHFDFYSLNNHLSTAGHSGGMNDFSDFWPAANGFFMNYNWGDDYAKLSAENASDKSKRYDAYEGGNWNVYGGMDQQGRSSANWTSLQKYDISIGIWGAHDMNMIYMGRGEDGSDPYVSQQAYLRRQEYFFTGGTRNPVSSPAVTNMLTNGNKTDGPKFHGVSSLMPAKSSLQELPFVTYFNLGNGAALRQEGAVTFPKGWYNIGMQDYLPTWRWWITTKFMGRDKTDVPENFKVGFTHEDAWNGGSALVVYNEKAQTDVAYVQLFKTKFNLNDGKYKIKIRYKGVSGSATMAWAVCNDGEETKELEKEIAKVEGSNKWMEKEFSTQGKGSWTGLQTLALLGLKFTNATANFKALIGEISIVKDGETYNPILPTIDEGKTKILKSVYNGVDFKVIWNSQPTRTTHKNGDQKLDYEPWYNEDVDTWYFNIWFKKENGEEILCTQTTSWAAYVVGAPANIKQGDRVQFGVQAVAPDGKTKSAIKWSKLYTVNQVTVLNNIVIDKPVIKANEKFTIKFEDPTHAPANWEIRKANNDQVIKTVNSTREVVLETGLAEEGLYDVVINGERTPGIIQISPAAVGAMPEIKTLKSDKNKMTTQETAQVTYTSRNANGSVSKGLRVEDPYAFVARVANHGLQSATEEFAQRAPYSYALWFKCLDINHDIQGTNLIYKTDYTCDWPQQNWGEFWVQIRPGGVDKKQEGGGIPIMPNASLKTVENEISFNACGWSAHDNARYGATAEGYPLQKGLWYHLVVTLDANNGGIYNREKIYINGRKVSDSNNSSVFHNGMQDGFNTNSDAFNRGRVRLYVGAGGLYKAGFNGIIDEVQCWDKVLTDEEVLQAMKGYSKDNVPENLKGYWTFEETEKRTINDTVRTVFPNWGRGTKMAFGYYSTTPAINSDGNTKYYTLQEDFFGDNAAAGCPMLPGAFTVETTPTWSYTGGEGEIINGTFGAENGNATVSASTAASPFKVYLTLKNSWGASEPMSVDINVIDINTELASAATETEFNIFPNPFVESVNMRFASAGDYTFDIFNLAGECISSQTKEAQAGEIVSVKVEGEKGEYILRVRDSKNQLLKSVKVIKK